VLYLNYTCFVRKVYIFYLICSYMGMKCSVPKTNGILAIYA